MHLNMSAPKTNHRIKRKSFFQGHLVYKNIRYLGKEEKIDAVLDD